MSRAFVKDAEYLEELPARPISEHPNDVTEAGLAQIEQALAAASEAYAKAAARQVLMCQAERKSQVRLDEFRIGVDVDLAQERVA